MVRAFQRKRTNRKYQYMCLLIRSWLASYGDWQVYDLWLANLRLRIANSIVLVQLLTPENQVVIPTWRVVSLGPRKSQSFSLNLKVGMMFYLEGSSRRRSVLLLTGGFNFCSLPGFSYWMGPLTIRSATCFTYPIDSDISLIQKHYHSISRIMVDQSV